MGYSLADFAPGPPPRHDSLVNPPVRKAYRPVISRQRDGPHKGAA